MIKNGFSLERLSRLNNVVSSAAAMTTMGSSRRFFNTGGITTTITKSSSLSSMMKRQQDMFRTGDILNLFRRRQTGVCVGSFVPHRCNKSLMLPYFARALASSSASQSSGQTPQQESTKKKRECQIITSSKLQRETCDEISSTKVSLNQFPGLMVHGKIKNSKTRRLLRLNPDTGYFEEQDNVNATAANHHGYYDPQVPNKHVCRGSAYGWLFLTDDNLDIKLLNPFSGAEIQLPPAKTLPRRSEEDEHQYLTQWFVEKAAFSANPSIEPRPVVLVIYGEDVYRLAFCKPGDKGWTPLEFPKDAFPQDVIYHEGQFYVLCHPGNVFAFDIGRRINDDDHSVKTTIAAIPPQRQPLLRNWYFVVLDGELVRFELKAFCFRDCCIDEAMQVLELLSKRDGDTTDDDHREWDGDTTDEDHHESDTTDEDYIDGDTTDEDYTDEESDEDDGKESPHVYRCAKLGLPDHTYGMKIRRFDVSEKKWVKLESLGDKAVFLGHNTSFSLSASDYPGLCIPDSVYFIHTPGGGESSELLFYDMGIYNVKDMSVKPLYPPMDDENDASQIRKPAPIWIVNSA